MTEVKLSISDRNLTQGVLNDLGADESLMDCNLARHLTQPVSIRALDGQLLFRIRLTIDDNHTELIPFYCIYVTQRSIPWFWGILGCENHGGVVCGFPSASAASSVYCVVLNRF